MRLRSFHYTESTDFPLKCVANNENMLSISELLPSHSRANIWRWVVCDLQHFFFKNTRNLCESQSHEDCFKKSTISGTSSFPTNNSSSFGFSYSWVSQSNAVLSRPTKRVTLNCKRSIWCLFVSVMENKTCLDSMTNTKYWQNSLQFS